jgi:hypothetical protein
MLKDATLTLLRATLMGAADSPQLFVLIVLGMACSWGVQAQDDSQEVVRLARAKVDVTYAEALERHRCIKAYLNSPLKGSPQVEDLFLFLLQNGFSIEDLDKAFFALRAPLGRPTNSPDLENSLMRQGVAIDRIPELAQWMRARNSLQRRQAVQMLTGVNEEGLLVKLLEFAPRDAATNEIAALRVGPPVEGERLLKDEDWMTEEHRKAIAAYQGQPRKMFPKPLPPDAREMKPFLVPRATLPGPPSKEPDAR